MWIMTCDQESVLEIFQAEGLMESSRAYEERDYGKVQLLKDGYAVIWEHEKAIGRTLPNVVVVPSVQEREFLAWVVTYIRRLRPFTAFIRVIPQEETNPFRDMEDPPNLGRLEEACIGAIAAETGVYLGSMAQLHRVAPIAFKSTYSSAVARGLALGLPTRRLWGLGERWFELRALTGQMDVALNKRDLEAIWGAILYLREGVESIVSDKVPGIVMKACMDLFEQGDVERDTLEQLAINVRGGRGGWDWLSESLEERTRAVKEILNNLHASGQDRGVTEDFLSGYLVSRIAPGTLDHSGLLEGAKRASRSSTLWYGVCAGLAKGARTRDFAEGMGRRIGRDLVVVSKWTERPRCDIALNELRVLLESGEQAAQFRSERHGHIEVELLPGIVSTVRWRGQRRDVGEIDPRDESRVLTEVVDKIRQIAEQALHRATKARTGGGTEQRGKRDKERGRNTELPLE